MNDNQEFSVSSFPITCSHVQSLWHSICMLCVEVQDLLTSDPDLQHFLETLFLKK